jgi:peptidase E
MSFECVCCHYTTPYKHHLNQHKKTKKHLKVAETSASILEKFTKQQEETSLRHIKEVEDLYVRQEKERKDIDNEMRLELYKRLANILNA